MPSTLLLIAAVEFLLFYYCYSIDTQGQALLTWKNTLNNSKDVLSSWKTADSSPCEWIGITCDGEGNVIGLGFHEEKMEGKLPANLGGLTFLQMLNLSATNLTGDIPKEIGTYGELTAVDFHDNMITGEIPEAICKLSKLEQLSLSGNMLVGSIPSCIGKLVSLKELSLYDNQLRGEIPASIGFLSNMEIFRVGGNKDIKGKIPSEIGGCSSLVMLGLAETSIYGSLPSTIGLLKKLRSIVIYTTLVSGQIPEEIGNCTELENLYLYQNSLTGMIPKTIGRLTKLQSLLLWQNNLVGAIPSELGSCTELQLLDLSENLLTGSIPETISSLVNLQEFHVSVNHLSGTLPDGITNCESLRQLEVDNNQLAGEIPASIGKLKNLNLFFAWMNNLTGTIPDSLADCRNLQSLDLSYNDLVGPFPERIFELQNLTKLLLISNDLSGSIPPGIGNCSNLFRLRLSKNRFSGVIPPDIGNLRNLNFVDLSNNHLAGAIPLTLSGCLNLEFLDFHGNNLEGPLPDSLPVALQYMDISDNMLAGSVPRSIGSMKELTKLNLEKNQLTGDIPPEISSCSKLQLLNLGDNSLSGSIPKQLCRIPALAISLNLSCNRLSGEIPVEFSGLSKLAILDLSHNQLIGKLDALGILQNLVSLNISFNNFSGELPNTPFFKKLPLEDIESNAGLNIAAVATSSNDVERRGHRKSAVKLIMSILIGVCAVLILLAIYIILRSRFARLRRLEEDNWEMKLYQKLDFSIDDVVRNLTSANVIGTGSSGVVYKVILPNGDALAVKKMWSSDETEAFTSEIGTLGSIRHRNIIRLLGWGSNKNLKLLFYNYLPNGSLSSMIHSVGKGAEWEVRYDIVVGVAHALAYLHHDCVPAILHGDVKAMNVLLGARFEPHLADFGLARVISCNSKHPQRPQLAGSYGYMAPEHASMRQITEKSDVYSYGVVLLEVLTGRHPLDPSLPGGAHLVQWVRDHIASKREPHELLDARLRGRSDPAMHEIQQTLAISLLCVAARVNDRPSMKDVVAMLKEIRQDSNDGSVKPESHVSKGSTMRAAPTRSPPSIVASSNNSFTFSLENTQ